MSKSLRLLPPARCSVSRIVLRRADERSFVRGHADELALARLVARAAGDQLLAWRASGSHLVVLVTDPRRPAAQLARRLSITVRARLGPALQPARVDALAPRAVRPCIQALFADLDHPFASASSLPDSEGVRCLSSSTLAAAGLVSLARPVGPPAAWPLVDLPVWDGLAEATAAVFGHQDLARRYPWRTRALSAAAGLGFPALGPRTLARLLGVSRSTIQRALSRPADRPLQRMIELRLRWQLTVRRRQPLERLRSASP